jgi:transposase-like protein
MDKNVAKISYNRLIFITLRSKKMKNKKSAFIAGAKNTKKNGHSDDRQRYKCYNCGTIFIARKLIDVAE